MTVLGRIVMALIGYAMACVAASLVLTIGSFAPDWNELTARLGMDSAAAQSAALWWITGIAAIIIFSVGFLPVLLVIALAEGLALRSAVIYGVVGAALALAMAYGLDFEAGNDTCPLIGNRAQSKKHVIAAGAASNGTTFIAAELPEFVTTRGGEYFFLPSMSAIRMLAMGTIDPT